MNLTTILALLTAQLTEIGTFVMGVWTAVIPYIVYFAAISAVLGFLYFILRKVRGR